jgi:DedD protein
MEDKNELSDIVLEKDDNKMLKTKRILVIAALAIVVFLLVLVVMKAINKPEQNNQNAQFILPPEPTAKEVVTSKDDQLFKQVPIIEEENDKKESFEEMVKSLKEKEIKKQEEVQPVVAESVKELPTPVVEKPVEPIKAQVQETVKSIVPVVETTAKILPTVKATTGVYIQVGATSKATPDKKFLASLSAKNYTYRLLPISVNGKEVTKILVGPYANTADAKNVLADVKASINKDAFIYRVK